MIERGAHGWIARIVPVQFDNLAVSSQRFDRGIIRYNVVSLPNQMRFDEFVSTLRCLVRHQAQIKRCGRGRENDIAPFFSHATGDLDMALYDSSNEQVGIGQSTDDNEEISYAASAGTYYLKVYGYNSAAAPYSLVVDLQ